MTWVWLAIGVLTLALVALAWALVDARRRIVELTGGLDTPLAGARGYSTSDRGDDARGYSTSDRGDDARGYSTSDRGDDARGYSTSDRGDDARGYSTSPDAGRVGRDEGAAVSRPEIPAVVVTEVGLDTPLAGARGYSTSEGGDVGSALEQPATDQRIDGRLFADLVLRESVISAASYVHGLRRAFAPETRNRIRFAMRQEVKRVRKDRKIETREALREYRARRAREQAQEDAA